MEPHPGPIVDLRLDCPFPKLVEYAASLDMEKMDSMNYSHVPFPIILLKCLDEWKLAHNNKLPATSEERSQFKDLVRSKEKDNDTENVQEAVAAAYRAWKPTEIPSDVKTILADPLTKLTPESTSFWIITRAVSDFVRRHSVLPLAGVVPDMKADTEKYVTMQTMYVTIVLKLIVKLQNKG
jgi:amyloid beta precursor protein binding protein 1